MRRTLVTLAVVSFFVFPAAVCDRVVSIRQRIRTASGGVG